MLDVEHIYEETTTYRAGGKLVKHRRKAQRSASRILADVLDALDAKLQAPAPSLRNPTDSQGPQAVGSLSTLPEPATPLRCLSPMQAGEASTPEQTLIDLVWMEEQCRVSLQLAQRSKHPAAGAMVALINQMRLLKETQLKVREAIEKAQGEKVPGQMLEWQQKIITALEPFPEAREAVLKAIEGKES